MLVHLSLVIICSKKLKFFLKRRFTKTVLMSELLMSVDKYPRMFSGQEKAIVYIFSAWDVDVDFTSYRKMFYRLELNFKRTLLWCWL